LLAVSLEIRTSTLLHQASQLPTSPSLFPVSGRTTRAKIRRETDFVDITAFGRTAEVIQKHLHKASSVFIEGRLKLDTWTDRESGKNRSKLKVVAESMQFVGPKPQGQSNEPTPSPALAKQREERERRAGSAPVGPALPGEDPGEIPF
jgi:single stranded DNA-binding protein